MEGRGPTPSHTHWCSLPSLQPAPHYCCRNTAPTSSGLEPPWKRGVRNLHSCFSSPPFPRDTTALGGQCWVSTSQGFAFLSCLTAFCHHCDSSLSRTITREMTHQNMRKSGHLLFSFSWSGHGTYAQRLFTPTVWFHGWR